MINVGTTMNSRDNHMVQNNYQANVSLSKYHPFIPHVTDNNNRNNDVVFENNISSRQPSNKENYSQKSTKKVFHWKEEEHE